MPRHEALKALEIYRRAGQQVTPESRRGGSLKYSKILKRSKHCFHCSYSGYLTHFRLGVYLISTRIVGV